jgi:peptidoglycan L-alanyl-D-glutamate endopeptidase CwlK
MTEYVLGAASRRELAGVHPALLALVETAIGITEQDFGVHDGLRTEAEQRDYVKRGVSKTMNSKHMKQADGFGHAVDLVPYINGKLRWEWKPIFVIAAAVRAALGTVNALRVADGKSPLKIIWGGVWDRDFASLPADAAGMEQAVNSYVARRRALGKTAFIDGPHFEMAA